MIFSFGNCCIIPNYSMEDIVSINAHRFQDGSFLNGEFSGGGDSAYHIFFFPRENAGFFKLNGNWTDIVLNRIIFISPNVGFSVKCEEDSLDCFHISFKSRAAYAKSPCYFTIVPPEYRHALTSMNIALATACLTEKQGEAVEHLRSILKVMDALVSGSHITYATRHESRLLRDIPRHFHEGEYQVEYFAKGAGTIRCGNRWMEFFPGSLCFIPPGIIHEIIYPKSGSIDNYSIKFKLVADTCLSVPPDAFVAGVSIQQQHVLLGLMKKIVGSYVQDIPVSSEKLYSLVRLINEINGEASGAAEENDIVSQVKKIVNANISNELRVTDIAWQLDLSHEYVSRTFRKHTGQTLTSYINSQRLKSSLILLKNTNIPFKQIATECGFKSVNYFHTVFKKYLSLTPRHIRKTRDKGSFI